ncbi:MAG: pyridoxal-dependent decarboxylase, exosortase A system-associated [Sphingomonadales bacterium]|nr:pyridoxal-dependent decarboxylase, exosortase A system-associated [Sphingomonadales bacterium]
MKPTGPIPPYFAADADGMLMIGGNRADALVEQAGDTPLFVYDLDIVRQHVARLRAAMPDGLALHYAIKANPWAPLLAGVAELVDGLDVASQGEMEHALATGMAASAISFAGPGKRDRELAAAIAAGITINAESEGEVARALAIGDRCGVRPRLAVRVNPSFDLKGSGMKMGGGAKPFGVDAQRVPALVRTVVAAGADWRGFHIFAGSQSLDADAIADTQAQTVALAAELAEAAGQAPPHVNIGGGLGVPYFPGDSAVDVDAIGAALARTLDRRADILADTRFAIELGRWFVAEAGVYLTRIVDRKISHDAIFLICDGGLHHQLAASGNFGTVIRRNYPIALANRFGGDSAETVSVVGPLCTPLDRLGDNVGLPRGDVGDLIAVFLAGAYGATASPTAFLGHPAPRELLVNG